MNSLSSDVEGSPNHITHQSPFSTFCKMSGSKKKSANRPPSQPPKSKSKQSKTTLMPAAETAPVAVSSVTKWRAPKMEYARDGSSCVVSHRERIGTVNGTTAFTATQYQINPGLVGTFPWLSAIANRFESYDFEALRFIFKTKTATTALGDVVMAVDFDASDSAPTSSIQVESYQSFIDGAPWQNLVMECRRADMAKMKQRFCRDAAVATGSDVKLYDVGNFFVCTENQASSALVGYLYVEYRVRLFTPQLRSSDFYISGGYIDGLTSCTAANPMGTSASVDADARGISINATTGEITIANPGEYSFAISMTGTVISALGLTATANCTVTSRFGTCINAASTLALRVYKVLVTAFNATMSVTATATTVTETQVDIASQPVNSFALWVGDVVHEIGCPQQIYIAGCSSAGMKVVPRSLAKLHCSCKTLSVNGRDFPGKELVILRDSKDPRA